MAHHFSCSTITGVESPLNLVDIIGLKLSLTAVETYVESIKPAIRAFP
jgi:hypothetical protein